MSNGPGFSDRRLGSTWLNTKVAINSRALSVVDPYSYRSLNGYRFYLEKLNRG